MGDGESAGEPGGDDKIEGESAEDEEAEEDVHKDGQELQCQGRDPKPKGSQTHRQDSQGRRLPWQAYHLLIIIIILIPINLSLSLFCLYIEISIYLYMLFVFMFSSLNMPILRSFHVFQVKLLEPFRISQKCVFFFED